MAEEKVEHKVMIIGGSAGSVNLLMEIIPQIPKGYPLAIIVVIHRKVSQDSRLANLLETRAKVPVKELENNEPILPGVVYLAPTDYHLLIENDHTFTLDYSEKINFSRPSIDVTMINAAHVFGKNLIGVLLTGANEDGARGMEAIQKAGGYTVIQDLDSAEVKIMPEAADRLIQPDNILSIHQFGKLFKQFHKKPELKKNEIHYQDLINKMSEGLFFTSVEGIINHVNPQFAKMVGYTTDELIGENSYEILAKKKYRTNIINKVKNRELGISEEYEVPILHKNGSSIWVNVNASPNFNNQGDFVGVISFITNITDRKTKEKELKVLYSQVKNSENQYKALVAESPVAILLIEPFSGSVIETNEALNKMFGYDSEAIKKMTFPQLFPKQDWNNLKILVNSLKDGEKAQIELEPINLRGNIVFTEATISNTMYGDVFSVIMINLFDITDRIKNEHTIQNLNANLESIVQEKTKELRGKEKKLKNSLAKEKELGQLKSRFVSTASHQFRTPLAVIQSNSDLLEMLNTTGKKQEPEKYKKITNRIAGAISKMTDLMDDVLTLGKLTSGNVLFAPKTLDLVFFCEQLTKEFNAVQMDGRSVVFVTKGTPYKVQLDPKLLTHSLSNLISNAFKYSVGKGNPKLTIHFKPSEFVLCVKDVGIGIPEAQQVNLFHPFFRADNVTKIKGTGLGLSIAKEYIEINKGSISAKSVVGEGSCFEVRFKR